MLHDLRFSNRYKHKTTGEMAAEFSVTEQYIAELLRGRIRPEKGYKYTKPKRYDRFKQRGPGANRDGIIKDINEKVLDDKFACPVCGCICHSTDPNKSEYTDYFTSQAEANECCCVVSGTNLEKVNPIGRGRQRGSYR